MFDLIEDIISDATLGRPFIITDDEDRENEGNIMKIQGLNWTKPINSHSTPH